MTPKKFYKTVLYLNIFIAIAFLAVVYAAWVYLGKVSRQVYEKEVYFSNFTSKVYALENLERSFNKIKSSVKGIEFSIPKEKNLERLMADLENSAEKNNLEFTVYKYADPSSKAKKKVEEIKDLDLTQTVKQGDFYEIPFEVNAEGRYPEILKFIKNMEDSKRFINIKSVELTKVDIGEGTPNDAVKLVSNISVYMKR